MTHRDELVFRGLRGRNLADQAAALEAGYTSMTEYAIDELGRIVLELVARVEAVELNVGLAFEHLNLPSQPESGA